MMTRLLMALFVLLTLAGVAALSGCDDDGQVQPMQDLSMPDLRKTHD
jgi:hypothetical protein